MVDKNLEDIRVTIYRKEGVGDDIEYSYVGSTTTDPDGSYSLSGLSAGTYRLKFSDSQGIYMQEYFDNKSTLNLGTDIVIGESEVVEGKNAYLLPAARIEGAISGESVSISSESSSSLSSASIP